MYIDGKRRNKGFSKILKDEFMALPVLRADGKSRKVKRMSKHTFIRFNSSDELIGAFLPNGDGDEADENVVLVGTGGAGAGEEPNDAEREGFEAAPFRTPAPSAGREFRLGVFGRAAPEWDPWRAIRGATEPPPRELVEEELLRVRGFPTGTAPKRLFGGGLRPLPAAPGGGSAPAAPFLPVHVGTCKAAIWKYSGVKRKQSL